MKQYGYILPSLLLILTLLFLAVQPLNDSLIRALRSQSDLSSAAKASSLAASAAMLSAFNYVSKSGSRESNKCFKIKDRYNRVSIERSFCASYYSTSAGLLNIAVVDNSYGSENLPRLDFSNIFPAAKVCTEAGGKELSIIAHPSNPESVFSSKFCQFNGSILVDDLAVAANLKISSPLRMEAPLFSIKGFLVSESILELGPGRHIIASAGDLIVDSLKAFTETEVTLISARGNVRVNKVAGPLSIRVFAYGNSSIPQNAKTGRKGFEELSLDFLPLGFED